MAKYLDLAGLTTYDTKIKEYIDSADADALRYVEFADNAINFYTDNPPDEGATPAFSVDMPTEYFLDQASTVFVESFAWSENTYPDSTDPSLEGEPVLVLAVKGDDDTITYSFVSLKSLIDLYTGGTTSTATVTVSDSNEITVAVNISEEEGNLLQAKDDGLYVSIDDVDTSGKADKLTGEDISEGQVLVDDGDGNLAASGVTLDDIAYTAITEDEINALFE